MLWEIEDDVLYKYNGDPDTEEIMLPTDGKLLVQDEMLSDSFHRLKIVHIPETVGFIRSAFFDGCNELTHIFVHPDHPYYTDADGVLIDKENSQLLYYPAGRAGEYTTPGGIRSIGSDYEPAFYHAERLTALSFPEGVEAIHKRAVCCCPNLTEVHIPASMVSIAQDAFTECYAIKKFVIAPENPVYDCEGCKIFRKDTGELVLEIVDYKTLRKQEEKARIADLMANHADEYGVYWNIRDGKVYECMLPEGLTKLHVPDGVESFEACALKKCQQIETLFLPKTIEYISQYVLCDLSALRSIFVDEENQNYLSQNGILFERHGRKLSVCYIPLKIQKVFLPKNVDEIHCLIPALPDDAVEVEKGSRYWHKENGMLIYKDGTAEWIADDIEELFVPESVRHLNAEYHDHLRIVHLPDTMEELDSFAYCFNLTEIVIPPLVKTIPFNCFCDCASLRKVVLPEGLETIETDAFENCTSLTEMHIPAGIHKIAETAFTNCPLVLEQTGRVYTKRWTDHMGIEDVNVIIPEGITELAPHCFGETYPHAPDEARAKVRMITLPSTLTEVNPYELAYCQHIEVSPDNPKFASRDGVLFDKTMQTLLCYPMGRTAKKYMVPDGVQTIAKRAFRNARHLRFVHISEGVRTIEKEAFVWTDNLTEIELPYSIKYIERCAFVCDYYTNGRARSKSHDHDITLYLCRGNIRVPLRLLGNWGLNSEECMLMHVFECFFRYGVIEQLRKKEYILPIMLYCAQIMYKNAYFLDHIRYDFTKYVRYTIDFGDAANLNYLLGIGTLSAAQKEKLAAYAEEQERKYLAEIIRES